ncbi:MAG: RNA polymerase sigma-54 factor [Flavobacteriales bacterium]|nr:RNA polymerase sigma-54 factor [Flavobacteriales bacterium]|tara:strand:- start:4204 stop:5652 length:1449 start_codon:yes stop_codon:yes gene_type:complete
MLKQSLQQKLLQKLSPQQIQLMKLLQLPTVALEQRVKEELESNPALDEGKEKDDFDAEEERYEERDDAKDELEDFDFSDYMDDDTPDYKYQVSNKGKDDDEKEIPYSGGTTFHERLLAQISLQDLSEEEEAIANHLIGSLDDSGYLRRDLESIEDDLAFRNNIMTSKDQIEKVLKVIQQMDPAGVGARDLQECLLLQINRKRNKTEKHLLAKEILENHFTEFTKKHYSKIIKKLEIGEEDLKLAIDEILRLNPKPGNSLNTTGKSVQVVVPDFTLQIKDGEIDITLNGRNAPQLRISNEYKGMIDHYKKSDKKNKAEKEAMTFVKQKLDSAKWFIDAIKQRQNTLMNTMEAIAKYQKDYFLEGDETKLKPMILKDIAERIDMDISTVSRVVNSKYVSTPYGTFLLKSFFSESISTEDGEEVSTREVKKILQDIIESEDKKKPYTDDKLSKMLKDKKYNIARRTVAKYREQLNIPVARLRKEL